MRQLFATLAVLVFATGCVERITSAKVDTLRLHETNDEQIKTLFGKPKDTDSYEDTHGKSVTYTYANTSAGYIAMYRIVTAEGILVEMRGDALNGYIYFSNDGDNATHVNDEAAKEIRPGASHRDDVLRLLGKPAGKVALPSRLADVQPVADRPGASEVWVYTNADNLNGWAWSAINLQTLLITFDGTGNVIEVSHQTATRKPY